MNLTRQLKIIMVLCILLTASAATIPAYLVIRNELEHQVRQRVGEARQHGETILQFEQAQLANLMSLAADRPTLHRLLTDSSDDALDSYLQVFRQNTNLSYFYVTDVSGQSTGSVPPAMADEILISVTQHINGSGSVTGIIRLDERFAERLQQQTGLRYRFLTGEENLGAFRRVADGEVYYGETLSLENYTNQTSGLMEIMVPVEGILANEGQVVTLLLLTMLLAALATSVGGGIYVSGQIRPLWKLTRAARRMGEGDLATIIETSSRILEVQVLAAVLEQSRQSLSKTLKELFTAKEWSESLISSIGEGIVTLDSANRILFFSEGASKTTAVPMDEAIGQEISALLPLEDEDHGAFTDYIPPEGSRRIVKVKRKDKTTSILAVTRAKPLEEGQTTVVLQDVSDEVQHRNLQAYFLANVSHEFRTPLTGMKVSIELLMENFRRLTVNETTELLNSLYLSASTLTTLVDNLLESSKIEANQLILRRQPTTVNEILIEATHLIQPFLNRREQTLALEEPLVLPTLNLDRTRIIQVVVNLLSNASKFSPMASCIEIRVAQTSDSIQIAVEDRGDGVPDDRRQAIFRQFVRLSDKTKADYGSGLGLAVVKAIVEAHGGQVGVETRDGGGSSFWFTLLLDKVLIA